MRVLVCDDDPAARFVAKRWLTSALGCNVTDCEDGVQALELLTQHPFDLALIDLDLPRLTGVEVVEAVRANELTHDLPIVILSQERREDVVRTLMTMGVSAYLLKPLRERNVLGRIGPLLASRRPKRGFSARTLDEVRLGPDAPAMLVDGDANFRHTFSSIAAQFGPLMPAESGADALARFRRTPVDLVFVGHGLGIMTTSILVKKIREIETAPTRVIGLGVAADSPDLALFDATMPRTFLVDALQSELRRFVRVQGALQTLEEVAPGFGECLTSGVIQVFGMMGGLEAALAAGGLPESGPGVVSLVTVDIHSRHLLDLELVLPQPLAAAISVRMLGCEADAVDVESMSATASELANMVSGRLDAWLKGKALTSHCTLPSTRVVGDGPMFDEVAPGDGFCCRFRLAELNDHVVLRVHVRQPVAA